MRDTISVREGGAIVPIVPQVLRRHPGLAARGVYVERHAVEPMEFSEREPQQHNFFMYTSPAVRAEIKSAEFSGMQWLRPGSLWVMPQGCRHAVRFEGAVAGIALAFEPGVLRGWWSRLVGSGRGRLCSRWRLVLRRWST